MTLIFLLQILSTYYLCKPDLFPVGYLILLKMCGPVISKDSSGKV